MEDDLPLDGPLRLHAKDGIGQDGMITRAIRVHDPDVGHRRLVGLGRRVQSCIDNLGAVGRPERTDVESRRRRKTLLVGAVRIDHIDCRTIECTLIDQAPPIGGPEGIAFRLSVIGEPDRIGTDSRGVNIHQVDMVDAAILADKCHEACLSAVATGLRVQFSDSREQQQSRYRQSGGRGEKRVNDPFHNQQDTTGTRPVHRS